MEIKIIPCLNDNYAYLLESEEVRAVVDPSEAGPVEAALGGEKLDLILITHHHWDHVGGVGELKSKYGCEVWCSDYDLSRVEGATRGLKEGEGVRVGEASAKILHTPGHTLGAICFWFEEKEAVFTGDTLFLMGCGRLFEGTAEQMWDSLSRLSSLPDATRIYCGHEYTHANAQFGLGLDPDNEALRARLGSKVPGTMAEERASSVFLRAPLLKPELAPAQAFAQVRALKDQA